ncbi:unnamed protein product [Durusdinium trenchii]|uniref:Uncharacterized protein n=2 Tax=Durusdinium trenchii TaxID=1381693 RepID=A0ABP0LXU6_9DINO
MDTESQLRRLRKSVEEQSQELARLLSELGQQSRVVKLLDETLQQTSQQTITLEHRLSNLEHERETSSRSTRSAFESLGARVTELGVEVAELPTAREMQASWQQLAQSVETSERVLRAEQQEALQSLSCRLEATRWPGTSSQDSDHCRQDVTSLQMQILEDLAEQQRQDITEPVAVVAAPVVAVPLVKRLRVAEEKLSSLDNYNKVEHECLQQRIDLKASQADLEAVQKELARKAELGHTHDCLVSADGSVTFSL